MTASSTDSDDAFELLHDRAKRLAYLEDATTGGRSSSVGAEGDD